jgi:hypothetical protein
VTRSWGRDTDRGAWRRVMRARERLDVDMVQLHRSLGDWAESRVDSAAMGETAGDPKVDALTISDGIDGLARTLDAHLRWLRRRWGPRP